MKRIISSFVNSNAGKPIAGWLAGHLRSRPVILLYHGVTKRGAGSSLRNKDSKHILLGEFIHHLRILKRARRVVSLQEMIEALRAGDNVDGMAAITFDDGYENNATVAASALADFGLTAAFFVSTGFVGTELCMWTDKVELILDRTKCRFAKLPVQGIPIPIETEEQRLYALKLIKTELKGVSPEICEARVVELADDLEVPYSSLIAEADHRFMNWAQVKSLADAAFEVGAHTVNHPILSRVSLETAKTEILASREAILANVGCCSRTFCYPNGRAIDYSREIVEFCANHFDSALSANRGHPDWNERYELRRFGAPVELVGSSMEWMLLHER